MRRDGYAGEAFDMTPMIDVVMLLLIFFLVTSEMSQSIRTQLDLPLQPGESLEADTSSDIVIDLLTDGTLRLEGETISAEAFVAMVGAEIAQGNADTHVLIRAERAGLALHLNKLCAMLSKAGVRAYRIATNPSVEGVS